MKTQKVELLGDSGSVFKKGDVLVIKKFDPSDNTFLVGDLSCSVWLKADCVKLIEEEAKQLSPFKF